MNTQDMVAELNRTKAMKLLLNIRKPKEQLSANKSSKVHIENFFDYMPLSTKVTREEFSAQCEGVISTLKTILSDF